MFVYVCIHIYMCVNTSIAIWAHWLLSTRFYFWDDNSTCIIVGRVGSCHAQCELVDAEEDPEP